MRKRNTLRIKSITTAVALALGIGFSLPTANAGIQATMESVFNSMVNINQPGVYEGVRRGAITGGGLNIHNRIVSAQILSLAMPDWRAGCGGIDFFGGAFSFINTDQLVQLMRAIAANASGYAFSLAIGFISEKISNEIKEFLVHVQEWTKLLSNSCEAAMVAVDSLNDGPHWQSFKKKVEQISVKHGLSQDNASAKMTDDTLELTVNTPEVQRKLGNIVYRSIVEQNASSWVAGSGDVAFAEEMMSLYGTVIVQPGPKTEGKTDPKVEHKESLISFMDLFYGGKFKVYKCSDANSLEKANLDKACTEMTVTDKPVALTPLKDQFLDILLGASYRTTGQIDGIIRKWHDPTFGGPTWQEENLLSNMTPFIGAPLWRLAKDEPVKAAKFLDEVIPTLTAEILNKMIKELGKAVREAVNECDSDFRNATMDKIRENEKKIESDLDDIRKTYGTVSSILEKYDLIERTTDDSQVDRKGGELSEDDGQWTDSKGSPVHLSGQ